MRRAAAAVAALTLLAGCRTLPPVPAGTPLAAGDPRVAALLDQLDLQARERRSLRALAQISVDAPELRFRRPQRLAVERPDRLRVETLGLFNQVIGVLVTGDGAYQLYDVGSRSFEQGALTPELLWRVAGVDLRVEQVVELFLGVPRPRPGAVVAGARKFEDGSVEIAVAEGSGEGGQRYRFDADGRLRNMVELGDDGTPLWQAGFGDYGELAGVAFASRVTLDFARLDAHASLTFKSAELNPDLPEGVFVLEVPADSML